MNYIYMYININNVDTVVTQDIEREAELDRLMPHAPVRKTKQKRGIYALVTCCKLIHIIYNSLCMQTMTQCVMCLLVYICTIVLCIHMYQCQGIRV